MEATSDYWRPPFYLFEAHGLDPWLVNAKDVKHLPGRPKSDRDALDPWRGDDEGWFWRRGFEAGFEGRDAAEDLAALPSPQEIRP